MHLQGYIEFASRRTIAQAKLYPGLERAHLEKRRGTKNQAIDYCSKSDSRLDVPWLHVDPGQGAGKRNDLKVFVDAVANGLSRDDCFNQFPEFLARYPRFVDSVYERHRLEQLATPVFNPREGWQQTLWNTLVTVPDPRSILWHYDPAGNTGKSWFAIS